MQRGEDESRSARGRRGGKFPNWKRELFLEKFSLEKEPLAAQSISPGHSSGQQGKGHSPGLHLAQVCGNLL